MYMHVIQSLRVHAHVQECCLTGAQQHGAPKKMLWAPKFFAAAPHTLPIELLTSRLLPRWAP